MHTNILKVLMVIHFSYQASAFKRFDQNDFAVKDSFTCTKSLQQPPEIKIIGEWPGNGKIQSRQTLNLICTAPYPVYWDDIPTKTFLYRMHSSVSANPLHPNPNDFCYRELVKILPRDNRYYSGGGGYSRTGNFTCRSSVDSTISTSRFVYSKDLDRIFSIPAISVTHSRIVNGSDWLIPCPANLKDEFLNVTLSKSDDVYFNDSSLMYPSDDPSIRYDSRYGFLLKTSHHSRPIGVYSCEATTFTTVFDEVSSQESVDMRLQDYNVIPVKEYVTYTNGNQIIVTCESDEDITINIEHSYKLSLKSSTQRKTSAFNFSITYVLEETADPESTEGNTVGDISCRIIKTNKILHTWRHDVRKICKLSTAIIHYGNNHGGYVDPYYRNSYNDRTETYIRFKNFDRRMIFMSSDCDNKAKCEMNLRDISELDSAPYQESNYGFSMIIRNSMIIRCGVETNYSTIILAVQTINETRLNRINVTSDEKINVTKLYDETDEIFIGDEVPFVCKVAQYFYSWGIIWKFLYKNGTESIITPDNTTEPDSSLYYIPSAGAAIKLAIRDSNITGVACSALVWNSTIWESSVFKLDIKDRQIWDENATNQCAGGYQNPIVVLKRLRSMNDYYRDHPHYEVYPDRFENYRTSNIKLASHIVTDTDLLVSRQFYYTLICIAKYPVKWTYEGISLDTFYRGGKNDNSGKGTIVNDTLHHCFRATYTGQVHSSSETGEFLCEKINDPKVNASLYIFANMSPASPIVNEGEHMTLYTDPKISQVYIPCRVTDPSVKLDLYYHEDHGIYKKLNNSFYVSYNPKKGFLMDTATLNFFSIYICATTNDTNSTSTVSFTFQLHETQEATSAVVTTGKGSKRSLLVTNFVFLILLIIGIIGLQLWFLRKQFKLDVAMTRIFGSYINMEPELSTNEYHGNCHATGNTQLIPSFF